MKMKRAVSLLLVLLMLLTVCPAGFAEQTDAEDKGLKGAIGEALLEKSALPADQPYLAMYVEYEKTEQYCTTHARATLLYVNGNGKEDNPAAKDIVIELKTEDTLELIEGSEYHVFFDELPCGGKYTFEFDLFCEFPMEQVEKAPEPKLTITVESSNVGGCEYVCTFDSTTEPRAFVWGWDLDDTAPQAIQNDLSMMGELFGQSYYNMQPVETYTAYNHPDMQELVGQVAEMGTDHNDVTYIYINAHGATIDDGKRVVPGFFASVPGSEVSVDGEIYKDKNIVVYYQLFPIIYQHLKGRFVFVFDICYSGIALTHAANTRFEEGQYSLLTSVNAEWTAGAYEFADGYGWFTKEVYDEFSGRSGAQTIGDVYSHMRKHADTHLGMVGIGTVDPQFAGNSDTVTFCFDPEAWIEDPEFVVVEESLSVQLPVDSIMVTTETTVETGEHFSSRVVRPHVYAEANPDLTAIVDAAIDELYQEKADEVERMKASAASCTMPTRDHTENLTLTAAYSTGGLLTLSLLDSYFDCSIGHNCNTSYTYRFDVATGELLEFENLLDLENNPDAEADFAELIGQKLEKEGVSASKGSTVYSEMLKDRYASWDISPRGIEISIDALNSGVMCHGFVLSYEELDGILKKEYLPMQAMGQMEVSAAPYDPSVSYVWKPAYVNAPIVNILELSGTANHVWVANSYGRNEVDGRCSYFYYYGADDALISLPEAQNADYGYAVAWIDGDGEHMEHLMGNQ